MAKLKAHGKELARFQYMRFQLAYFEDGVILRNAGYGWKSYRKVKKGIDPMSAAENRRNLFNRRLDACPCYARLLDLLKGFSAKRREMLLTAVDMMPDDPDGVWSTCEDYGFHVDLDDCVEICRLFKLAEVELKTYRESRESLTTNETTSKA